MEIDMETLKNRKCDGGRINLIKQMREEAGMPPEKNPQRMKSNGRRR